MEGDITNIQMLLSTNLESGVGYRVAGGKGAKIFGKAGEAEACEKLFTRKSRVP